MLVFGVLTCWRQFNISVEISSFDGRIISDLRRRIQLRTCVVLYNASRRDRINNKLSKWINK